MNVIVTGATKGIGKAIAELMLKEGHNVVINARNSDDINKICDGWSAQYPNQQIMGFACDMEKKQEVLQFAETVLEQLKIDVLVNNAGVFVPGALMEEAEESLEHMIRVNLYSAYHLSRKIVPSMISQGFGHVFNMCSVASIKAYPNGGSYSISKFALLGFSKVLREELKDKGIKVTSILPGATWSNSWAGVDLPKDRLMEANDIALSVVSALNMSRAAVVEEIIVRPQLGDL